MNLKTFSKMEFQILYITFCLIYQAFAGGPSYPPSSEVTIPTSPLPLCVNCVDVWTKLVAPSSESCDIGDKYLCTVSGTITETNQRFSGYCAGQFTDQTSDTIDTATLSDVEISCVA